MYMYLLESSIDPYLALAIVRNCLKRREFNAQAIALKFELLSESFSVFSLKIKTGAASVLSLEMSWDIQNMM